MMTIASSPTARNDARPFEALAGDRTSACWQRFLELGLPSSRDEDWLYTDVRGLRRERFSAPAPLGDRARADIKGTLDSLVHDAAALRLIFVNGNLDESLSNCDAWPTGIAVTRSTAPPPIEGLTDPFVMLNYALQEVSWHVAVEAAVTVQSPLYVAYVNSHANGTTASFPRLRLSMGSHSSLSMHTLLLGAKSMPHLNVSVESKTLEEGAALSGTVEAIDWEAGYLVHTRAIEQAASSSYVSSGLRSGGSVSRDSVRIRLRGEEASVTLGGLTLLDGTRRADTHVEIVHDVPKCKSAQQFRGILGDGSASGFTGRVVVKQDAQLTAAEQANHNLVLTDSAVAHTRPQLEIYADDVRCTHGATIGRLDDDALFYLRARSIDEERARTLLMEAFGRDALAAVEDDNLRDAMEQRVRTHVARVARNVATEDAS